MVVTDICRNRQTIRSARHNRGIHVNSLGHRYRHGTDISLIDGLRPGYQCNYREDVIADNAVSAEHEEERYQGEFPVSDVFDFFAQG